MKKWRSKNRQLQTAKLIKRLLAFIMTAVMILSVFTWNVGERYVQKAEAAMTLSNPRIVPDSSMEAGQKVTWDCIYFGSYPQAEVITTAMSSSYTAIGSEYLEEGDLIVSDSIYQALSSATGWDANGDITLNGTKYRRMKRSDATYAMSGSSEYYNWTDSNTYHYFKYEPIKWRVLSVDGNKEFLLADKALDDRRYNIPGVVTWENSPIRSWLNGYGASVNTEGIDYNSSNFIDAAFTAEEQSAIYTTTVENADNINYGTEGGNNTADKIFLLSEAEVYTEAAESYGFVLSSSTDDEARRSKASTYAKAMGTWWDTAYPGNCKWWLRSPGYDTAYVADVNSSGYVESDGSFVSASCGVRVALNLNLSSSNLWSYAGTVCSDGTADESGAEKLGVTGISFKNSSISIKTGTTYQLQTVIFPSNATNKGVTYQSSDTKVVTVDETGLVTAVSDGTAMVTVTTMDGAYQARASITVIGNSDNTDNKGGNDDNGGNNDDDKTTIKKTQTIKASTTKYTKVYGNKAFKLGAKTTGNGKLTYKSSNTKVVKVSSSGKVTIKGTGKATITVKAAETREYKAATKKLSIIVKPKQMAVKKLTSPKKGRLKVSWAKNSNVSGYEIIVATNKKFTKNKKTYKVKSYRTTARNITRLKSGKTYYVRIRGYKTVKGSKTPLYGRYSKVREIKVK